LVCSSFNTSLFVRRDPVCNPLRFPFKLKILLIYYDFLFFTHFIECLGLHNNTWY